jgi:hypothetical protein
MCVSVYVFKIQLLPSKYGSLVENFISIQKLFCSCLSQDTSHPDWGFENPGKSVDHTFLYDTVQEYITPVYDIELLRKLRYNNLFAVHLLYC